MPPYKPPKSGTLPKRGKRILRKVYVQSREGGYGKTKSAKIAWNAVRKAGYKKRSYAKKKRR
jgi:hypothetical protein